MEKLKADAEFLAGNYETAADMYLEGARDGDALSAFNYGYCLWRGYGRACDPTAAKSYFAFARDLDGGAARYNLALMYLHGDGVPQDFNIAHKYMRESAEDGCIEAELYMGMATTLGCMFEPDVIGICLIPYHKAEYRDVTTPLLSGYVPDFDREDARFAVVKADAREAFLWFQRSARHDATYASELVAKGKYLYAKCFIDGLGTEFDRQKGTRLMIAAGKSGSGEAVAFLKENGVTPEMIRAIAQGKN
jgi:TPR repeat protein